MALEVARTFDPLVEDRPFRRTQVSSDAAVYAAQRQLHTAVMREPKPEPLVVEEAVIGLLRTILSRDATGPRRPSRTPSAPHMELTEAAKALLSARFTDDLNLGEIAAALGVSVFHACRVFHRVAGCRMHEYRHQLRLRWSLEQLATARPRTLRGHCTRRRLLES